MENRNYADVIGSTSAPYLTQLANTYGLPTNYHSVSQHGSLPEYLALTSANSYDTTFSACNNPPSTCNGWPAGGVTDPTIMDRIEAAGLTWKAYMEDMPSNCYSYNSGHYMAIHNPFIYYSHVISNSAECDKVVPAGTADSALLSDLGSTSTASNYMWLTPNNCDDMWGCNTSTGDTYLSNLVPQILNSQVFQTRNAALFITWDEGTTSSHIPAIWAGPSAKHAYTSSNTYGHYSFLSTLEKAWNLPALASNDANASPMTEFLTTPTMTNPDFTISASPSGLTITAGTSGTSTITVGSSNGFSGTILLTHAALPAGISATINPTSINLAPGASAGSTLTITTSTSAPPGSYAITITGNSGSISHSTNMDVTVTTAGQPEFAVQANPTQITLRLGQTGSSTVTLTSVNGFSGSISLSATGAPSGPTLSLSSSTVALQSGGTVKSTLTIAVGNIAIGKYVITVTATSGQVSHSVTIVLTVARHHH